MAVHAGPSKRSNSMNSKRSAAAGAEGAQCPAPACPAHMPAYYVALDHTNCCVNLVVRGTSALRDLVTDLEGHCVPFFEGGAWRVACFRSAVPGREGGEEVDRAVRVSVPVCGLRGRGEA